jgi:MFS family permease
MGVGAAMVFPSTLSLISNVFTERQERALAIGLWGAITGVAIALGPIVGGWLLELSDWRSIFFAMAPIAAARRRAGRRYVPTSRDPHAPAPTAAGSRCRPRRSGCSSTRSSRPRTTVGEARGRSAASR